jgi:hypothetical protein
MHPKVVHVFFFLSLEDAGTTKGRGVAHLLLQRVGRSRSTTSRLQWIRKPPIKLVWPPFLVARFDRGEPDIAEVEQVELWAGLENQSHYHCHCPYEHTFERRLLFIADVRDHGRSHTPRQQEAPLIERPVGLSIGNWQGMHRSFERLPGWWDGAAPARLDACVDIGGGGLLGVSNPMTSSSSSLPIFPSQPQAHAHSKCGPSTFCSWRWSPPPRPSKASCPLARPPCHKPGKPTAAEAAAAPPP